jgi:hypothetical protein
VTITVAAAELELAGAGAAELLVDSSHRSPYSLSQLPLSYSAVAVNSRSRLSVVDAVVAATSSASLLAPRQGTIKGPEPHRRGGIGLYLLQWKTPVRPIAKAEAPLS